jgi:2-polyprenyl-3-methyl-5-hydroxy-6-metoxy-1,4-benzoquinol methylase
MHDPEPPPGPSRRERWDERHAGQEPIESSEPDPTLLAEVGALAPGHAIDLGAGDGRNAVWLARRGWAVTAVDFSQVALGRGRALAAAAGVLVEWELADLLEWSPGARQFDLVTLFFIHLPPDERREVYARAAAAVAPGGTLLIVGHDRTNIADGVGGPQDPDLLITPSEVAADLTGFRIDRAETVQRGDSAGRRPIDAIVRAVRSEN